MSDNKVVKSGSPLVKTSNSHTSLDSFIGERPANVCMSDVCVCVDSSGSMNECVGNMTKWEHLLHALNVHFKDSDAHCISFSSSAFFTTIQNPVYQGSGTNLSSALKMAQQIQNLEQIIIISDGEIDDIHRALELARELGKAGIKGDCIFIGNDYSHGAQNLKDIAATMNGSYDFVDDKKGVSEMKRLKHKIACLLPERIIRL